MRIGNLIDNLSVTIMKEFEKMDDRLEMIDSKFIALERGQRDILLRQDSAAQHFEVAAQEKTLEDHGQRIVALENRVFLAG